VTFACGLSEPNEGSSRREAKPTDFETDRYRIIEAYHLVVTPSEEPIGLFVTRTARTVSRAFDDELVEHGSSLPSWVVMASLAGGLHRAPVLRCYGCAILAPSQQVRPGNR
jgi:hypothetical protein